MLIVRVKCSPDDTVGDLKRLIAAQTGTDHTKIQLKKWYACLAYLVVVVRTVSDCGPLVGSCGYQVHDLQGPHHSRGLRDP